MTIVAAIKTVQALQDLDEDFLFEALDFLEIGENAAMFMAVNSKFRSRWLRTKLSVPYISLIRKK